MGRISVIALSIFFATSTLLISQKITASEDEADIRNAAQKYGEAFNKLQPDKLADLWTNDAIYINFSSHQVLQGKDEITKYFENQFADDKDEKIKITINSVKIPEPGKAIEKGEAEVTVDGKIEKSTFVANLIKQGDSWLLQKVMEVDIQPAPSHYEHLKDLEWLIGKWESSNDNINFSSVASWDENKNFIQVKFKVIVLDQVDFEGQQILGWDPQRQKIRSWIFDSDGGFGEGWWTQQDNQWLSSNVFTFPDGRKGTATNKYKKESDKSFTFSSEDRDIEGKILPNIQPVLINKV